MFFTFNSVHCRLPRKLPRKESGLALVSVLLVVAILVVLAADGLMRQRIDIRSTQNTVSARQGWHYALAGERWARQLLHRDLIIEASSRDHLGEAWAARLHRFPFEEGKLFVRIEDANSRFNLNNIIAPNRQLSAVAMRQWQGLLQSVKADAALANELSAVITGKSQQTTSDAASNGQILELVDTTELLLLPSMDPAPFKSLQPFISAVPGHIKLNVNTAKMPVLQHISPILTGEKLTAIKDRQQKGGFATVDEFLLFAGGTDVFGNVVAEFGVTSDFFIISVRAEYANQKTYLQSLVYRDRRQNRLQVIQRQRLTELDDDILNDE
jgi:general secretion pathway protein K